MKTLFILLLSGALGMGAVFGKVGERNRYPTGPRYTTTTPTATVAPTATPLPPTDAPPGEPCVIDWSVPATQENLIRNSECYRLLYYDPISRSYPGAPPFCPPNNSEWEQFFDWSYLYEWCYENPPTATPTEISPYPPPAYP